MTGAWREEKWEIKAPVLIHPSNTCGEAEAIPPCMIIERFSLSFWLKVSSINFTLVFKQNETWDLIQCRSIRAIFVWSWKMVSVSVRYLFYQLMAENIKKSTLRSPAKGNPNMERALFDWPIVLQYDVKAKYRLISRKFTGMKFLTRPFAAMGVCIRSINQSNRSIYFVCAFSFQGHTKIALSPSRRCNC